MLKRPVQPFKGGSNGRQAAEEAFQHPERERLVGRERQKHGWKAQIDFLISNFDFCIYCMALKRIKALLNQGISKHNVDEVHILTSKIDILTFSNCSFAGKLTFKEFYNSLKSTLELKDLADDDFEEE